MNTSNRFLSRQNRGSINSDEIPLDPGNSKDQSASESETPRAPSSKSDSQENFVQSKSESTSCLAWCILCFAAMNVIFLGGKRRGFGIFVAQLRSEFNTTSLAELDWIGDSYAALGYLTTSLSSALILRSGRKFALFQLIGGFLVLLACVTSSMVPSPHWLFATHTVFHGAGSSLVLSVVGLIVNEHFDKSHRHHILATTLVSGGSVASIVFVQIYAKLVDDYGWRKAFNILGVVYFIVIASGAMVFRKKEGLNDYGHSKISIKLFFSSIGSKRVPLLALWIADRTLTSIVTYGILLNLPDYSHFTSSQTQINYNYINNNYSKNSSNIIDNLNISHIYGNNSISMTTQLPNIVHNFSKPSMQKSSILATLFAAGEATTYLIGAIVTALTKSLLKNRFKYILTISTLGMVIVLTIWEFCRGIFWFEIILAFLAGFCLGPSITFLFPAGEEMTLLPGHLAYPLSLGGMGLGMAISPICSGFLASTYSYNGFFMAQSSLMFLKFGLLVVATLLIRKQADSEKSLDDLCLENGNGKHVVKSLAPASDCKARAPDYTSDQSQVRAQPYLLLMDEDDDDLLGN